MTATFEQSAEAVKALPEQKPDEFRARAASRRRSIGGWLLLFVGWLGGSVALALDLEDTRHLLDRVAFGPTPARVAALAPLSREEAVDRLLQATAPPPPAPTWARQALPDRGGCRP